MSWLKKIWTNIKNWVLNKKVISKEDFNKLVEVLSSEGKNLFDKIDTNNNGYIELKEIVQYKKDRQLGEM